MTQDEFRQDLTTIAVSMSHGPEAPPAAKEAVIRVSVDVACALRELLSAATIYLQRKSIG